MSKSKKVAILLIMAFICAVISGIAIYEYCNSSKEFIYVFNADYNAGTKIETSMFSAIKVDSTIVQNGKKSSADTYYITGNAFKKVVSSNEYLLNDVYKNQPLTYTDLAELSGTTIERSLSDGMMAVTIPISGTAAVTDDLRVGSVVNIYATDIEKTELLFENMKIIALEGNSNGVSRVTFETDYDDTLQLINCANNKNLYFSLSQPKITEDMHSGYVGSSDDSSSQIDTKSVSDSSSLEIVTDSSSMSEPVQVSSGVDSIE